MPCLCVDSAAFLRRSAALQAIRKRIGGSDRSESSTQRSTLSATSDGVVVPAAYACAKSLMVHRRSSFPPALRRSSAALKPAWPQTSQAWLK